MGLRKLCNGASYASKYSKRAESFPPMSSYFSLTSSLVCGENVKKQVPTRPDSSSLESYEMNDNGLKLSI